MSEACPFFLTPASAGESLRWTLHSFKSPAHVWKKSGRQFHNRLIMGRPVIRADVHCNYPFHSGPHQQIDRRLFVHLPYPPQ